MNWFKPMLLMVVLGGIGYGVYTVLNKGPAPEPPPGIAKDWSKPLDIQPGAPASATAGSAPSSPWNGGGSVPPLMSAAPPFTSPSAATTASGPPPNPAPYVAPLPISVPPDAAPSPPAATSAAGSPASAPNPITPPPAPMATGGNVTPTAATLPLGTDISATAAGVAPTTGGKLAEVMESVQPLLDDGKLAEALKMLTRWYESPQFTAEESRKLDETLGRLAGTVVYSRKNHQLRPAFEVRPGDTLQAIAEQYKIPWQLLAKINGINDPNKLVPGEKLKVLQGPFMALVEPDKRRVTLLVEECYAGRFIIGNQDVAATQKTGEFQVTEKSLDHPHNRTLGEAAAQEARTREHHWIGFGDRMGLCAVEAYGTYVIENTLSLPSRDGEDLYDILSVGSRIMVRR